MAAGGTHLRTHERATRLSVGAGRRTCSWSKRVTMPTLGRTEANLPRLVRHLSIPGNAMRLFARIRVTQLAFSAAAIGLFLSLGWYLGGPVVVDLGGPVVAGESWPWISIGVEPVGIVAIGAQPTGVVAVGGLPIGLISIGGLSLVCSRLEEPLWVWSRLEEALWVWSLKLRAAVPRDGSRRVESLPVGTRLADTPLARMPWGSTGQPASITARLSLQRARGTNAPASKRPSITRKTPKRTSCRAARPNKP